MLKQRGQKGFTLIEMVVVIAILAVLSAVAVPLITNYIGGAKERAYNADKEAIQAAVEAYYSANDNTRYIGKRQYPIDGMDKTGGTFYEDDGDAIAGTATIDGNPQGGYSGGNPVWVDDGDGIRGAGEEVLNDEDAVGTEFAWHVVDVTRGGTTYYVDTRDYLIDISKLVTDGHLKSAPASASADNGTGLTGSYSWYVDANGMVQSLYYYLPIATSTGSQGVHP